MAEPEKQTAGAAGADRLRLVALDEEDLLVFSAHLQDAVVKVADMRWLATEGRFACLLNRFAWEREVDGARRFRPAEHERRRTGLAFDRVKAVRALGIRRDRPDEVLALLALTFEPGEAPSGTIQLAFAGGATLRLEVETVEVRMDDLGPAWSTPRRPTHEV